jgi:hypothetical protein
MKFFTYEGFILYAQHSIAHSERLYFLKDKNGWCALFETQGGGKKRKAKSRDENPIIYLTVVLEVEKNSSDVFKGDIMIVV